MDWRLRGPTGLDEGTTHPPILLKLVISVMKLFMVKREPFYPLSELMRKSSEPYGNNSSGLWTHAETIARRTAKCLIDTDKRWEIGIVERKGEKGVTVRCFLILFSTLFLSSHRYLFYNGIWQKSQDTHPNYQKPYPHSNHSFRRRQERSLSFALSAESSLTLRTATFATFVSSSPPTSPRTLTRRESYPSAVTACDGKDPPGSTLKEKARSSSPSASTRSRG